MVKGQLFIVGGVIFSVQCFMSEKLHNVETLEEDPAFDPLVKNFELGSWSSVRETAVFETYSMQPITNDLVISRLTKKNQLAANDLILKQVRLQACFNDYHDLHIVHWNNTEDKIMRIKSKHFTDARDKALLNFTWK